jgi:hypothetical protein
MAVFHSLHIDGPLCLWNRCCLQSFADHGHEIIVFGYEHFATPPGVRWAPAQDVVPVEEYRTFSDKSPAQRFADYFRYTLLYKQPAFWVDTDVLCLSATLPDEEIVIGWEDDRYVNGAILRLPPGHAMLAEAIKRCQANEVPGVWGDLGPVLLTQLTEKHGLRNRVLEPAALYPVHYTAAYDLADPACRETLDNLFSGHPFAHLYQTMFRWIGFQTDFMPPVGSFLANAFSKHGGVGAPMLEEKAAMQQIRVARERRALRHEVGRLRAELAQAKGRVSTGETPTAAGMDG